MSLLDDLKKQAEQQKAKELSLQQQQAQKETVFRTQVIPALQRLHKYLYEMAQQLNYLKLDDAIIYQIHGYGEVDNFRQNDYSVRFAETADAHDFFLRFSCVGNYPLRIECRKEKEAKQQKDYLWKHNMRFSYVEESDKKHLFTRGFFEVEPVIYVQFDFVGNTKNNTIDLTIKNFPLLGKKEYTLLSNEVDTTFLDELAKYILRKPNTLILRDRYQLATEYREKLERCKLEKQAKEFDEWLKTTQEEIEQQQQMQQQKKGLLNGLFGLFSKK